MTDETTQTNEKQIILVAAAVAGRTPDGMTIEEARQILRGADNELLDTAIDKAAQGSREFFTEACRQVIKENPTLWQGMAGAAKRAGVTTVSFPYSAEIADALYNFIWTSGPDQEPGDDAAALENMRQTTAEIDYKSLFFTANLVNILGAIAELSQGEPVDDQARTEKYSRVLSALRDMAKSNAAFFDLASELQQLEPLMNAELDAAGETVPLTEIYKTGIDTQTGTVIPGSRLESLIAAARTAANNEPAQVSIKRADIIEYPLDKPNSIIWSLLEKDTRGQIAFNMAKYGSRQKIPVYYAINFDDLGDDITITKRLLPFDKRAYIAISALFNAGNRVITLSQIYYAMGNTGRPGTRDLTKINDSITKMTGARIFFDNEAEAKKYKYTRFKYDGSLLPLERGTAIVNGQLADAAIHIFREPPLITFAKERKQITSINIKLLQSPISKTDANLQIDDYLIERISKARNGKGKSCRILLKTLYSKTGITTKKQAQRAPDKIRKYLEHYQAQNFISRFSIEPDGITVYWE